MSAKSFSCYRRLKAHEQQDWDSRWGGGASRTGTQGGGVGPAGLGLKVGGWGQQGEGGRGWWLECGFVVKGGGGNAFKGGRGLVTLQGCCVGESVG